MIKKSLWIFLVLPLVIIAGEISYSELILNNGMHVSIQPTEKEPFAIKLTANGGYAAVASDYQAAWRLAPKFFKALSSKSQSNREISLELAENALYFDVSIEPMVREIEAEGERPDLLLGLIKDLFGKVAIEPEPFLGIKSQLLSQVKREEADDLSQFEQAYLALNSCYCSLFNSLQKKQVESVTEKQIAYAFHQAFSNPSDFNVLITGDFDRSEILELVEKTLGTIQRVEEKAKRFAFETPHFPEGIVSKTITKEGARESVTRVTFLAGDKTASFETIANHFKPYGIEVLYKKPLGAQQGPVWVTLQFLSGVDSKKALNEKDMELLGLDLKNRTTLTQEF